MSAAWARGDKCPFWNAEMNSWGEKRLSWLLQRPHTRGFLISNCRMWGRGEVAGETGSWGRGRQTLDCEPLGTAHQQQLIFLLSSPWGHGFQPEPCLLPECSCCLLTSLGEWGCVCLASYPTPRHPHPPGWWAKLPHTNGFVQQGTKRPFIPHPCLGTKS